LWNRTLAANEKLFMNIELKSFSGPGRCAMTLLLAGCLAAAAQDVGVFTPTGSLNDARVYHTTTLLANGQVLVAAGQDTNGFTLAAELYDPATGYWTPTGGLNNARAYHTATLLANGQVLVAGGDDFIYGLLSSAELYDPATGAWSYTGDLNSQRYLHTAILLPSGQVLVVGGYAGYGVEGGQNVYGDHTSAELYDPTTGAWSFTGDIDQERDFPTATLLANGKVLLTGGDDNNGYPLASVELYDPATGRWTRTGSLGTARDGDTVTLLPNGKVLVAGGDDTNNDYLVSAELYDPATGAWSPTGSLNDARGWHTATLLPNGKVLVAGGDATGNSAELYDPATANWTRTGSLGTARDSHTATLLPNGQVLIAGGYDDYGYPSASAELYGPALSFLNPIFNHPVKLGDGSFQFGFAFTSGPGYSVLASPDLAAPLNSWKYLGPAIETPSGSGLFQFTDPQAPNYPQRFYRVSLP
jgi:N-acetylneuraminic acid mutarotase